jgi:glycosyltransferase involved in cell wall biosynthesis
MLYQWDWDVYQNKGVGGSETAVCEMAYWLKRITGRRVIVFNDRETDLTTEGVEYISNKKTHEYFGNTKPALHIAWRHNLKCTDAPTYVWNHDLFAPHIEQTDGYDKLFCLSGFHKDFVHGLKGIPTNKIAVTRNGIRPERFQDLSFAKDGNTLIFSSSPDRGLDNAMRVMDYVVKEVPDARLKVFYGFDNMEKFKMWEPVNRLKAMISDRPYVQYIGNIDQKQLAREFARSKVWLYPTNFLETFCITALESLAARCYPVVRDFGALPYTLAKYREAGMCDVIDNNVRTEEQIKEFADHAIKALRENAWERVNIDLQEVSWESVAREWIRDWLR